MDGRSAAVPPLVDLLFIKRNHEAKMLTGTDEPGAATACFRALGATDVVVKLAEKAASLFAAGEKYIAPGFVIKAVYTEPAYCSAGRFWPHSITGKDIMEWRLFCDAVAP